MLKSWSTIYLPDEVAVKPSSPDVKATLLCKLLKDPLRVEGTLLLDADLPHEIVAQLPSLRDIRVTLRFNEERQEYVPTEEK